MGFKLLKKQWGAGGSLGENEISFSKSSITFGNDFKELVLDRPFIEIYLDRIEGRVGFKPTNNSLTGYKIQYNTKTSTRPSVNSTKVTKLIPSGKYIGKIDEDGFIVIKSNQIFDETDKKE